MARKNPVPFREIHIGARLREARESTGLSRVEMAKRLGIDSASLANYEHGRVPTPYRVASQVAASANVNQRWLALGKSPREPFFLVPESFDEGVPKRLLFSFVYDRTLSEEIESVMASFRSAFATSDKQLDVAFRALGAPSLMEPRTLRDAMLRNTVRGLERLALALPERGQDELIEALHQVEASFLSKHHKEIDAAVLSGKRTPERTDADDIAQRIELLKDSPKTIKSRKG